MAVMKVGVFVFICKTNIVKRENFNRRPFLSISLTMDKKIVRSDTRLIKLEGGVE